LAARWIRSNRSRRSPICGGWRFAICPKVTSLEPLAEMKRREYLSLRTLPSWAGKFHFVKTLKPIASLKNEQAR